MIHEIKILFFFYNSMDFISPKMIFFVEKGMCFISAWVQITLMFENQNSCAYPNARKEPLLQHMKCQCTIYGTIAYVPSVVSMPGVWMPIARVYSHHPWHSIYVFQNRHVIVVMECYINCIFTCMHFVRGEVRKKQFILYTYKNMDNCEQLLNIWITILTFHFLEMIN